MNRRNFLGLVGLGAAGMVLDPERLLWVPGQRTYVDLGPFVYRTAWGDWIRYQRDEVTFERWVMTTIPAHGYRPAQMYGVSIYADHKCLPNGVSVAEWSPVEAKLMANAKKQLDDKVRRALLKRNVMT